MTDAEKAAFFSLLREKGAALMGVADLRGIVAGELQLGVSVAIPVPAEIVRDLQTAPTLAYLEAYAALNAQLNDIVTSGAGFFQKAVGGGFFRFRATYALIGERLEQRECAMGGCIHKNFPFQTNCCAFIIPKCGANVNPRPVRTKSRFCISRVCKINV